MPANLEKSAVDTWVENVFFQFQSQRKAIPKKMKVKSESESHSVVSDSLQPHGLYSPWNSPGQNTRVGSLSLLQWIFPTQGSNPGLPHCRRILYQLSHEGSPRILEWVAYPFSSRSFWPRYQPGSPALQADSLPTESSGKPNLVNHLPSSVNVIMVF